MKSRAIRSLCVAGALLLLGFSTLASAQGFRVTFADETSGRLVGIDAGSIMQSEYDGRNARIMTTPDRLLALAHTPADAYYVDWKDDGEIYLGIASVFGGQLVETRILSHSEFTAFFNPPAVLISPGESKLIWSEQSKLRSANTDGTSVVDLVSDLPGNAQITFLDFSQELPYWRVGNLTQRSELDGGDIETLFYLIFVSTFD